MANRISDKMVNAFERFNADLKAFGEETGQLSRSLMMMMQKIGSPFGGQISGEPRNIGQ